MEDNTIRRRNHIYYSSNIFAILIECYQTLNDQTMFNLNHFPFTIRTLVPMKFIDSDVGADRLIRRFVFRLKTRIQLKNPKLCIFKKPSTAADFVKKICRTIDPVGLSNCRTINPVGLSNCRTIDLPPKIVSIAKLCTC